jgi:hypothetical protein
MRNAGIAMKWEECLKIRWKPSGPNTWSLKVEGVEVAIVRDNGSYYTWAAGGQFDWHPGRKGAMHNARWAYWVNRSPRFSATVILNNNA